MLFDLIALCARSFFITYKSLKVKHVDFSINLVDLFGGVLMFILNNDLTGREFICAWNIRIYKIELGLVFGG